MKPGIGASLNTLGRRLAVLPLPTRLGWYFVVVAALLIVAGATYGENAFVLLGCMPLAMVLVNMLAAWLNVRCLEFRRELPGQTHAGENIDIGLIVENRKRWPSFGLELDDTHLPELYREEPRVLVQSVPARGAQRAGYIGTFGRRGRHRMQSMLLTSAFPFGLARMSRRLEYPGEIIVYPRPYRLSHAMESRLLRSARFFGESAVSHRGQEEVFGVREYLPGHNVARIHWPTTARTGKPMVLELEGRMDASFVLVLDAAPVGDPATLRQRLEAAIGLTAGLTYFLTRQGVLFRFAMHGSALQVSRPGRGDGHYHAVMERLALAGFSERPLSEWIEAVGAEGAREVPVLISLGPKEHAEARLPGGSGAIVLSVAEADFRRYVAVDPLGRRSVAAAELADAIPLPEDEP